jgi:Ni/Co efflux regulator RcnB
MNTKRILISVVAGAMLTGSVAMAARGNDQARSQTRVRAAKNTTTAVTTNRNTAMRTRQFHNRSAVFAGGNTTVRSGTVRNRSAVYAGSSRYGYSYPYRSYGYGYGYPYYSYGPSVSFGFGYPYSYGYYPYGYSSYYPYDYSYGYYNRSGYDAYANGSLVIQVQSRLARAGYYHGPIDGAMGPRTHYAIRAYERDHGLRMDGVISGALLRNMGLRY